MVQWSSRWWTSSDRDGTPWKDRLDYIVETMRELSRQTEPEALVKAYSDYIYRLDGSWYVTVKKTHGNDEAFACDRHVWEKKLQAGIVTYNVHK